MYAPGGYTNGGKGFSMYYPRGEGNPDDYDNNCHHADTTWCDKCYHIFKERKLADCKLCKKSFFTSAKDATICSGCNETCYKHHKKVVERNEQLPECEQCIYDREYKTYKNCGSCGKPAKRFNDKNQCKECEQEGFRKLYPKCIECKKQFPVLKKDNRCNDCEVEFCEKCHAKIFMKKCESMWTTIKGISCEVYYKKICKFPSLIHNENIVLLKYVGNYSVKRCKCTKCFYITHQQSDGWYSIKY